MSHVRRAALIALLAVGTIAASGPHNPRWGKIRDALSKGLPKSALASIDPIIARAEARNSWAEAIRAILLKTALEAGIQGNRPDEKIPGLQAALPKAPAEMRPVMEAVLADWYWQYFQQNRWRYLQRTTTATSPGDDFRTWDLARIYVEIDRHFTRALAAKSLLSRTPIADYDLLLDRGNADDRLRPTLYDFVVFEALQFYGSGEQAAAAPEDAFVLQAEGPAFAPREEFARWSIAGTDTASPVLKGLRLYQDLLRFHRADRDPTAYLDADLWRLEFVHERAVGTTKDARYAAALEHIIARDSSNALWARAIEPLARLRYGQGDAVTAHGLAQRAADRFPNSVGGRRCRNLISQIEEKSLNVTASENVWNSPPPTLQASYRNVDRVFFRLVPIDCEGRLRAGLEPEPHYWQESELEALLATRPLRQWSGALPPTKDFRARTEQLPVPADLPPGFYVLLSSAREDFARTENTVAAGGIWVSDLSLVLREGRPNGMEGFVLDAKTGAPIEDAEVSAWSRASVTPRMARTNRDGLFHMERGLGYGSLIVTSGRRRLGHWPGLPDHQPYVERPQERTMFFTDRALYRPGQTIHYKGLCIRVDPERNDYATLPWRTVRVVLQDPNGEEVAHDDHVTNAHGSFSGSFAAPTGGLRGQMQLLTSGKPEGWVSIAVEEYKRPKFFVTLEAPKQPPRLADRAELTGLALAYTGAPIDGAKVEWRVMREVRYPRWWEWCFFGSTPQRGEQAIAHGSTTSDAEGRFTVAFSANPDSSVPPEQEPTFCYTVTADITDGAGETRSASRVVNVGYTALAASLSASSWLDAAQPIEITVRTTSLDGAAQAATGGLTVLRLREPERITRRLGDPESDADDVARRPEGPLVAERSVTTDTLGETKVSLRLSPGDYHARFRTHDRFGREVTAMMPLRVLDPKATRCPLRVRDMFLVRDASVEPGSEFLALWGTAYDSARAFVEIECHGQVLQSYWTNPRQTQVAIRQRVTESMRGGFTVRVTRVAENRAYLHEQSIAVPWTDHTLDIRWEHFVSKLTPGQRESWTAIVTRPGGRAAAAEMVATLYDASLDAFAPFFWGRISGFRQNADQRHAFSTIRPTPLQPVIQRWARLWLDASLTYRSLPTGLLWGDYTYGFQNLPSWRASSKFDVPGRGPLPGRGRLAGHVRGTNGQPVSYANVLVIASKQGTTTDVNGQYVINDVAPGAIIVRVMSLGYDKIARSARIQAGKTTFLDFKLGAMGVTKSLEEIEVRAEKKIDTRSSTSRQSIGSELRELPVDNLSSAVATKAGVVGSGDGLHFRGGRAGEVVFSMDGLEISDPLYGGSANIAGLVGGSANLAAVVARRDLRETAFFLPHLRTVRAGEVRMEFTVPEALTEWHFLAFAHDNALRSGMLEARAVTSKDLMVQPNPPRFLREGDELEFTVKVTNRAALAQRGQVRLTLFDAIDDAPADARLGNRSPTQPLDLPPRGSHTYAWRLRVPDRAGVLRYKAVAATAKLSDGEEGLVPILARRVLVIESLPLPIRGPATRTFEFAHLRHSGESATLRHQSITVQVVSNPAWYAVMALPYLMEYPYECSEQTFNRLYANSLARHIANSQLRIRAVFDAWRGTPALDSPLEKNQELKSVMISETPWLRQVKGESQARRNVGILFESSRLDRETTELVQKLARMQAPNGMWPWFPGGEPDEYITLYITTGFGRLRHLGVDVPMQPAARSLEALDDWADRSYRAILACCDPHANHLSSMVAFYLYGRSFFLSDHPVAPAHREAVDYWLEQARAHWLKVADRQTRGHLALALKRFGDPATAKAIMRSVHEYSVSDPEMGMFWRDTEYSWWWYRAPIETQALMIEAFDEVMADSSAVEDCRVWLLKQKQTQDWKTTKATADAVYALLLRGTNILTSKALVEVSLGDSVVRPGATEAGTGFYEKRFEAARVRPEMGRIRLAKSDPGVAWGSVHWQYLEDMDRVPAYAGTPLRLEKSVWLRATGKSGRELRPIDDAVHVGDELIVRIVLRTDRDMEYVHLEDYRGSGVEPVNVLSAYRYQDGLRYYEETRDVASHFFIDYLPKGTYVFEYPVRVQHRGKYTCGVAQVQCMYAPEFNSHSAAQVLVAE